MMPSLLLRLPFFADAAPVSRTWTMGHEGIQPGWAVLAFAVLALATVLAYLKFSPGVGRWKRIAMIGLRVLACGIVAALFAKPVLRVTEYQPVKQPLAVLVDASQSMALPDRRESRMDLNRAAIAAGLVDADTDISRALPEDKAAQVRGMTRHDLVTKLGANKKLGLWETLGERADLLFYRFGANAKPVSREDAAFPKIDAQEPATAIGEAVRQVLQEPRGQALGGVVLITDGGNNQGSSPLEAAQIAREQNVPLFIYGVGATSPPDLDVKEVNAQGLAFIEERLEVRARISSRSLEERPATVTLKADGETADQVDLILGGDQEQEVVFHFVPKKAGEVKLEVSVPVRDEEISKDNNTGSATVRVTDRKFNVLLIEQAPRWDFRYLLDYLQRDPRLEVKGVMIDGEPGLDKQPDSPFLPALPDSREALFKSQVLILGDVNPADLGQERMEMIAEWVEAGGGLIFLAGSNFNPASYVDTPLEPLLPVVPDVGSAREVRSQREPEPFPLDLTAQGRRSPYLQMDADPVKNRQIWDNFPGVRWVAPVARIKPGAEVLLVDPRPSSAGRYGMLPVFAMQGYGSGKCVYFGTDETYRWRSKTGEKYYSVLWGQIMQTLALQLLDGASSRTQLRTDRKVYAVGDKVVIAGNAYTADFGPLMVPTLEGVLSQVKNGSPQPDRSLNLMAGAKNSFRGEFTATEPGRYAFHTQHDPEGVLKFEVVDTNLESSQTALDDRLLKGMAAASGGKFLREEDLRNLPGWISATTTRVARYRKIDLYDSPWVLSGLLLLLFAEWLLRRTTRLK